MEHHFNIYLATGFGVDEAIFVHNLYFWIQQNKANNKHMYDGKHWTYNTMKAYGELFPYWNTARVRRIIESCRRHGLIETSDEYNEDKRDRTLWYAVTEIVNKAYAIRD